MGRLYIVPTPIGNLKDITFRAIDVLKSVDLVLAEDTRQATKLLNHYEIKTHLQSHHKFNEHKSVEDICNRIEKEDIDVALISDAGTPAVSDPGFLIVRTAIERDIVVETLPGATALIPALVNSGLPCERFCFEGFLPVKKGRNKKFTSLETEERTMVFYESPYRLTKTLTEMSTHFGSNRKACVARELTKIYEENRRGTLAELVEYYTANSPKGEIVIVVEGYNN